MTLRIPTAWLCLIGLPHKWRRLRKAEIAPGGPVNLPVGSYRICARCGKTRLAAKRKVKS